MRYDAFSKPRQRRYRKRSDPASFPQVQVILHREEELAVFDFLTRPDMHLTQKEASQVKKIAHDLLATLKAEKLVLDWRKKQQSQASVRLCIDEMIAALPERYPNAVRAAKSETIYQHVYDAYSGEGRSVYAEGQEWKQGDEGG